jgi:hypothetical protein
MNLNEENRDFLFFKEIEVDRVPVIGEKILFNNTLENKAVAYVYTVVDVHFEEGQIPDVFVIKGVLLRSYLDNLALTYLK